MPWAALTVVSLLAWAGATVAAGDVANTRTQLLDYLADLPRHPDQRVLSGQQVGDSVDPSWDDSARNGYPKYVDALQAATGKRVALVGGWYVDWGLTPPTTANMLDLNAVMKNHWHRGGLVTMMFGPLNPWTGNPLDDVNLLGHTLTDAVTPGTAANASLRQQLDNVAVGLADLRDAGVVVLWRPWHELNGGWFWWGGAANGQDFINLWRYSHDYLTTTKQLNNLIWVFAVSPEAGSWIQPIAKYYPGDAYVDVVGLDVYSDTFDQYAAAGYQTLSGYGKPIVLAEFGPDNNTARTGGYDYGRLMDQVRLVMPNISYVMCWSDGIYGPYDEYWSPISNHNAVQFLTDSWVVNVDGVPSLGRTPTVTTAWPTGAEVSPESAINVTFSLPMNETATRGAFSLAPTAAGTFSWSPDDTTLTFTPSAALAAGRLYTVTISTAAMDRYGWPLSAPYQGTFTTATAAPTVVGATGVDATHVDVLFSKAMQQASAETTANYSIPYLAVSAAALQPDGKTVRLTTTTQPPSRTFTVFVSHVQDLAGTPMARTGTASWTTPLAVARVTYVDPTHVDVLFSAALDKASAETLGNYSVPYLTVSAAALQADTKTVRLTTGTQPPNRTFTVFVKGVKDQAGGGLARTNTASWNTPAPSLMVTSATYVNPTQVDVLFSEAVQQASAETLGNYSVPYLTLSGAVLQGDGKTVRLATTPQPPNRTFTVFVSKVKNAAGVAMVGTKRASWTTPGLAAVPALTAVSVQTTPAGVAVMYSLSAASAVEITVTNVAGRVVARIPGGTQESGTHTALWSGRGTMGTRVPGGRYLFQVTAADAAGNRTTAIIPAVR